MKGGENTIRSSQVLRLLNDSQCSAYNCEFVALAQDLNTCLNTSDRKILKEFPEVAVSLKYYSTGENNSTTPWCFYEKRIIAYKELLHTMIVNIIIYCILWYAINGASFDRKLFIRTKYPLAGNSLQCWRQTGIAERNYPTAKNGSNSCHIRYPSLWKKFSAEAYFKPPAPGWSSPGEYSVWRPKNASQKIETQNGFDSHI